MEQTLVDPKTERCRSPVSVIELFRLWQNEQVPDNPDTWLDLALPSWRVLPVTVAIARPSVLFELEPQRPGGSAAGRHGLRGGRGVMAHGHDVEKAARFSGALFRQRGGVICGTVAPLTQI